MTLRTASRRACDIKPGDVIKVYSLYGHSWRRVGYVAPQIGDTETVLAVQVPCWAPDKPHWWSRQRPIHEPPCIQRLRLGTYAPVTVQVVE